MVSELILTTEYQEFSRSDMLPLIAPELHTSVMKNGFNQYASPHPIDIGTFASIDFYSTLAMSKYHLDCPLVCIFHLDNNGRINKYVDCLHIPADNEGMNIDVTTPLLNRLPDCVKKPGHPVVIAFTTNSFRNQQNGRTDTLALIQGRLESDIPVIEVPIELVDPNTTIDNQRVDYVIGEGVISAFQNVAFGEYVILGTYPIDSLI
jgi:hypothetical protein